MLRTIIIDDDQNAIDYLKYVADVRNDLTVVGEARDVSTGVEVVRSLQPDLLLLDVQMPGNDGFDLLKKLENHQPSFYVIFTTAHSGYAIQAIRHAAFDFLLKPVQKEEFNAAIDRLKGKIANSQGAQVKDQLQTLLKQFQVKPKLRLNTRSGFIQIPFEEILFCEADSNYTVIYRENNTREICSIHLGEIERTLSHPAFARVGRSYLFNYDKIDQVETRDNKVHFSTTRNGRLTFNFKSSVIMKMRQHFDS
ncbi:MAG: LytTR family DNA-binding domain-containing protein [Bacteroidota bacterium]